MTSVDVSRRQSKIFPRNSVSPSHQVTNAGVARIARIARIASINDVIKLKSGSSKSKTNPAVREAHLAVDGIKRKKKEERER